MIGMEVTILSRPDLTERLGYVEHILTDQRLVFASEIMLPIEQAGGQVEAVQVQTTGGHGQVPKAVVELVLDVDAGAGLQDVSEAIRQETGVSPSTKLRPVAGQGTQIPGLRFPLLGWKNVREMRSPIALQMSATRVGEPQMTWGPRMNEWVPGPKGRPVPVREMFRGQTVAQAIAPRAMHIETRFAYAAAGCMGNIEYLAAQRYRGPSRTIRRIVETLVSFPTLEDKRRCYDLFKALIWLYGMNRSIGVD